jgi:hypothetical protein
MTINHTGNRMKSEVHHPFVPMYSSLVLLKTHFLSLVPFTTVCCVSGKKNCNLLCRDCHYVYEKLFDSYWFQVFGPQSNSVNASSGKRTLCSGLKLSLGRNRIRSEAGLMFFINNTCIFYSLSLSLSLHTMIHGSRFSLLG